MFFKSSLIPKESYEDSVLSFASPEEVNKHNEIMKSLTTSTLGEDSPFSISYITNNHCYLSNSKSPSIRIKLSKVLSNNVTKIEFFSDLRILKKSSMKNAFVKSFLFKFINQLILKSDIKKNINKLIKTHSLLKTGKPIIENFRVNSYYEETSEYVLLKLSDVKYFEDDLFKNIKNSYLKLKLTSKLEEILNKDLKGVNIDELLENHNSRLFNDSDDNDIFNKESVNDKFVEEISKFIEFDEKGMITRESLDLIDMKWLD